MRILRPIFAALLLANMATAAFAADWQHVLSDRNRRVEIDRGSILSSDAGTKIAWGRVVLTPDEAGISGYAMIKALNRYDCRNRTFVTVKRVYVDAGDNIMREEAVPDQVPLTAARGSVDERMWREVCDPPTVADLQKLASEAARLAGGRPAAASLATVADTPQASAREQSGAVGQPAGEMVRVAEPAAVATHVEIPAKFLPGGKAAAEPEAPRASILPPLQKPEQASVPPRPEPQAAVAAAGARATPAETPRPRRAARVEPAAVEQARPAAAKRVPSGRSAPAGRPPAAQPSPVPQDGTPAADALRAAGIRITRLGAGMPEWGYDGETGPQHWGSLRPEWRICADGARQSPIDLRDGIAVDLAPVQFDYRRTGFRIRDTGNMLQVDVGEGMGMTVRGVRYALEHFTLHRPSQDRVGGMAHDMAIYLQHRSVDGELAILSLLLSAGGAANPVVQALWNNLPLDRGRAYAPDVVLDLGALVPADPGHFLYTGSLPMPPCSEDVLWVVMKQPVPISDEQLAVFARLYPRNGRPIQPTNGRLLLESR